MQKRNANALRMLAVDAIEKAQSGHPGAPMGMADIAEVLWNTFVRHDPNNPSLVNRDRVILSNGHASMLLYAVLYLTGYKHISLEDIQNFRQLGSITTGHPEYDIPAGIEMTTGPLGQGLASAVGMALGMKLCAEKYNQKDYTLFDNYTYVFLGDGCLMEGISHEACSLAGTLGVGNLIALYDSNGISIDGVIDPWFADNTVERFRAYNWHVIEAVDGHDANAIRKAIEEARSISDKPTLICFSTVIGYGSPNKAGSGSVHGSPLGAEEVKAVRTALGWEYEPFVIPEDIYAHWNAEEKGAEYTIAFEKLFANYQKAYPELASELRNRIEGIVPQAFEDAIALLKKQAVKDSLPKATRISSKEVLATILPTLPHMIGGSADLTPSVGTFVSYSERISPHILKGNYLSCGVREFGMFAVMNGLALYENALVYGGTFLVFVDYAKPALRLAAMMKIRTIWILTHDSIGVGEDGPTHQPIEHLTMLRTTPNVQVWRPADFLETIYAWEYAVQHITGPVALIFSRQNLPAIERTDAQCTAISKGGYIVREATNPIAIIIATGSEVMLAVEAYNILEKEGIHIRVISMPSTTVFDLQSEEYKKSILSHELPTIVVEAGEKTFWYKYMGRKGRMVGMDSYGASGKGKDLFTYFGITTENIVSVVKEELRSK